MWRGHRHTISRNILRYLPSTLLSFLFWVFFFIFFRLIFTSGTDLISPLILFFFLLVRRSAKKTLRLGRFKSDRDEIWQDCSSCIVVHTESSSSSHAVRSTKLFRSRCRHKLPVHHNYWPLVTVRRRVKTDRLTDGLTDGGKWSSWRRYHVTCECDA